MTNKQEDLITLIIGIVGFTLVAIGWIGQIILEAFIKAGY